ncbi:MAG: MHYT domain-containing protein, partial [Gemmatimonadaceae bacterium]
MMEKSYSLGLIILSVVVAAMGAYVAVEIAQRVRASEGRRRVFWTYGGAFAMGIGIWGMHFVGLLALRLPIPIWYDTLLIFASLIPAVAACAVAFFIFNRTKVSWWSLGIASLFMGAALAGMHYTGMAGMRMNGLASYEPVLIGVSAGISVVLSLAALILIRKVMDTAAERRRWLKKIGASLVLAAAVVGMHYAGLAAANFTRGLPDWRPTDDLVFATFQLGLVIAIISMALLILALFAAQFERSTIATRNRFENLLHLLPQVVWFGEPDGKISYCNPYWYAYTGLSEKHTLGDGWIDAIHPDDRERVVGSWRAAVREGNDYEVELRLRDKDGQYCWFLARSRSSRDESGKVNAWLGIAVDIEERKKAEEEAWAASQAKSEFLASMSHELRTPLNAIGGYAELLAMGVRGSLNAEQAQDIARIRRSQQHLLTLINDVLNFAKVDAGQAEYRLTAVPVDEALHDTESMIAPQILAKGLRYTYKGGDKTASVLADPEKLQQIVLNLLTNAVKFTDPGGS